MRVSDLIEQTLSTNRDARNNDKALILEVWEKQGLILDNSQLLAFFEKCSSAETIRRVRQKLQEQGKYLADEKVEDSRYEMYKNARATIPRTDDINAVAEVTQRSMFGKDNNKYNFKDLS